MKNTTRLRFPVSRCSLAMMVVGFVLTCPVGAEDWPQWRGPDRLAVWDERGVVEGLPEELKVGWRVPIRSGFSGPAVADGRVFITDWQEAPESRTMDGSERTVAIDEQTGQVLWTREWPTTYRMLMSSYAIGPRATPTVDDDRVYVVGASGMLLCCTASGFLDSGLTVFASTPPRPAQGGRVAPGPGFGSRTSPASSARCTSA